MERMYRTRRSRKSLLPAAARAAVEALEDRRLLSAGEPDPTFGAGGLGLLEPTFVTDGRANAVAVQTDGKIVAAGDSLGGDSAFSLVRYNPDGSTDTSFGVNGLVRTVLFGSQQSGVNDVLIQPDGKIVAAGYGQYSGETRFAAVRYLPDGRLDSSFSGDGIATRNFGAGDDRAMSVAIQPGSGKIVLAGFANGGGAGSDMAVVRFNANGAPDTTFNGTGHKTIDFAGAGGPDAAAAVLVGDDGKITVGGWTGDSAADAQDFALLRLNPGGALDTTFDGDGKQTLDFDGRNDAIADLAFAPDGSIVAAGRANVNHLLIPEEPEDDFFDQDAALARFTSTGATDASFGGGDGKVTTAFGLQGGSTDDWSGVAVLGDGRIVAGGTYFASASGSWAAARYLADGTLDSSFGDSNTGTFFRDFGGDIDLVHDLAVQNDGKVVLVGQRDLAAASDFSILRLTAEGAPDTTFARAAAEGALSGRLEAPFGRIDAVGTQSDGKVLAVGQFIIRDEPYPGGTGFQLARFNTDGTLDLSFGDKGLVGLRTDPDTGPIELFDVQVLSSGKVLVSGAALVGGDQTDFYLARLNPDGSPDTSFGDQGSVTVDFGGNEAAEALATDPSGNIYLAGTSSVGQSGQPAVNSVVVAKVTSAGLLDTSFDTDGKRTLASSARFEALAADSAGRPIVAVTPVDGSGQYLVRLTTAGAVDATYGAGGRAAVPAPAITDLVLTPDDRALVSQANTLDGSPEGFIVRSYTSGGAVDTFFGGGDGLVTLAFANGGVSSAPNGRNAAAVGLALQPDGKIVVGGLTASSAGHVLDSAGVLRLTATGDVDTTFASGTIALPATDERDATSLTLGPDGRPILAGYIANSSGPVEQLPFVARFQTDPGPAPLDPRYFRLDADGTLHITGTAGDDFITASRSGDLLHVGESRRSGADPGYGDVPFNTVNRIVVDALAGSDDVEISFGVTIPTTLNGGDGDDTLVGGGANDVMVGGAGNDTLYASPGADDMSGGGGYDAVNYGARVNPLKVTINDNAANDGEAGEGDNARSDLELIVGGAGNDTLTGNAANNVIFGNGGDDLLQGLDGNDQLTGGPGRDRLYGGNGNDTLYGRDNTADYLDGGTGFDTAQKDALDAWFSVERFT